MLALTPNQRLITVAENAINARLKNSSGGQPISQRELQAAKYALKHLRLLQRHVDGLQQCG
jgi:hypothetical protein